MTALAATCRFWPALHEWAHGEPPPDDVALGAYLKAAAKWVDTHDYEVEPCWGPVEPAPVPADPYGPDVLLCRSHFEMALARDLGELLL